MYRPHSAQSTASRRSQSSASTSSLSRLSVPLSTAAALLGYRRAHGATVPKEFPKADRELDRLLCVRDRSAELFTERLRRCVALRQRSWNLSAVEPSGGEDDGGNATAVSRQWMASSHAPLLQLQSAVISSPFVRSIALHGIVIDEIGCRILLSLLSQDGGSHVEELKLTRQCLPSQRHFTDLVDAAERNRLSRLAKRDRAMLKRVRAFETSVMAAFKHWEASLCDVEHIARGAIENDERSERAGTIVALQEMARRTLPMSLRQQLHRTVLGIAPCSDEGDDASRFRRLVELETAETTGRYEIVVNELKRMLLAVELDCACRARCIVRDEYEQRSGIIVRRQTMVWS